MRSHYQQKMRSLFSAKFGKCDRSFCVRGKRKSDWVVFGYAIALAEKNAIAFSAKFRKGDRSFLCWWEKSDWVVLGYAIALPAKNAIAFFS
ncbi:hypothetical protein [Floridanema aerugineum]|uniref:Uncharacterized protein n=1 Tax=Floridaenema aerugineum BLCC-F46 TaxID=3153654 RepID=A0ABV4X1R5_9CYAN